ncbi:MAG: PspA/IM30 family protein [Pontiellaceae bacterium]|nr:PspA/IM30 family protein [Pontiellaceae bacterium]MBN2785220.1 PspA/IM30 family protein [Pontiellaceae bacterium]
MNIRDRLKNVFKETFLDLFHDEEPTPDNMDSALEQARSSAEKAMDALAAFTVSHLHLAEQQHAVEEQFSALNAELESALAENDDSRARNLIRKKKPIQNQLNQLNERMAESNARHQELKARVDAVKGQVLDIERRKMELQLRDRTADAMDELARTEDAIGQAHNYSESIDAEQTVLQKEAANQVTADQRNTIDAKLNRLIEDDEVEQELARLKKERN